jgi:hypothetical protein
MTSGEIDIPFQTAHNTTDYDEDTYENYNRICAIVNAFCNGTVDPTSGWKGQGVDTLTFTGAFECDTDPIKEAIVDQTGYTCTGIRLYADRRLVLKIQNDPSTNRKCFRLRRFSKRTFHIGAIGLVVGLLGLFLSKVYTRFTQSMYDSSS